MTIIPALALALSVVHTALQPAGSGGPVLAVPFTDVRVHDGFWAPRLEANRAVTLAHVLDQCERTGRVANFEVAAGAKPGGMTGYFFNDSDVYKTLEGAAYVLATHPDPAVEARCDEIIEKIAAAQQPDGYLYTPRAIMDPNNPPPGGPERWSDMGMGHELYCAGHLYEAAVAYSQATGKRRLLDVATKNADLVAATFGPGRDPHPCGHPEIEIGLAKLYGYTGDRRYLDLMQFFIDMRGRSDRGRDLYGEYAQDHAPVLEQTGAVGHAVRLAYLYAGVTDLATMTGQAQYLDASERVWDDIVRTKLYVTGGVGSQGNNEGFGAAYDLPNSSAYNETCSSIAMVLWSHRLNLATGEARYADLLERTLYNALLASWSLSGDRFFYPNPLESPRGATRAPWFNCACCPPNVMRFFASMPGLIYAASDSDVFVNLLVDSDADVTVAGAPIKISQETRYPWDGRILVEVAPEHPTEFSLRLRVPGWAVDQAAPGGLYRFTDQVDQRPTIALNDAGVPLVLDRGYAVLEREWKAGDVVELVLPLPVRLVAADERVAADRGRVALQRGPLVYCLEAADNAGPSVLSYVTDLKTGWVPRSGPHYVQLVGNAGVVQRDSGGAPRVVGHSPAVAIPYYAWANRNRGPMCVWTATDPEGAKPAPYPTIAFRATPSSSFGGDLSALADQMEPRSSGDHDNAFLHWWPRKGTEEWVQYDFAGPAEVSGVEVYWFDDTGRGDCRLPASWRLLAKVAGEWREVEGPSGYGIAGDRYNRCTFDPVQAEGLRLVVRARDGWAGGIHEWRVLGVDSTPARPGEQPGATTSWPNLLPNPSFEAVEGERPEGWDPSAWSGEGDLSPGSVGHSGDGSVMISSRTGADVAWSCTVPVEMNSRYRLGGWIRTEGVVTQGAAHGALLNIHNIQTVRTPAVTGSHDWTMVEVEFETGLNDSVTVNCLFGGWGLATGRAWFDDVSLTLLEKGETPSPAITIDASRTGEPISKYIYGQFIEHLGRCIYGGIWAEMLEDRKFFWAIGSPESPWKEMGTAAGRVTMDAARPFVGQHSVRMDVRGGASDTGIAQTGLGLIEGKRYVGHVWLAGDGELDRLDVALHWGPGEHDCVVAPVTRISPEFLRTDFSFTAGRSTDTGFLLITAQGPGVVHVGTISLMPADNIDGFRADTLALLKELDSPVYRWPGGNFVSGYDWRDGIGDRDRRPPRKNPAWQGVEHNDVGIHEFMALCELIGTEPYIAINAGLGSVRSAGEELEYLNGPADSPMGRLRAENGRREPWGVEFIGVGNEMYGSWQLGNVPLEEYTRRHNEFVEALRAVDPSVKIVGVGAVGEWSRTMLRDCAEHLDLMSEHVYWQDRPGLLSHVMQAPDSLRATADAHRAYRRELESLSGRDIRICEDEWNYWYGPHAFGELGTRYFMKDALGCAAALHEFGRNSDIYFMANYAQTVNVIGAIKTTPTHAAMETTGLVLQLYRRHFGVIPCETETTPTVDALAAWSADCRTLTIGVVNASTSPADVRLDLRGADLAESGTRWEIASDDPMAFNDPDGARPVQIRESTATRAGDTLSLAPCSVTLFSFAVR